MIITVYILALIAVLAAHFFVAREFYKTAIMKGWSQKKYFVLPFLLWIPGYLLIIALPDRAGGSISAVISDDLPEI
ncbi:MAG: hypothetical protein ACOX68_08280 [Candidatus Limivicinus sp.]